MSAGEGPSNDETSASTGSRQLYVEFELRSVPSLDCPLEEFEDEVTSTSQQFTGETCHTDTTVERADDGKDPQPEVVHTRTDIQDDCHCPVFLDFDCIPEIIATDDDRIVVRTYLSNRELLTELVEDLKAVTETLSLRRLMRVEAAEEGATETTTLDLSTLTELEQETAMRAVGAGYYQRPREISLSELAAEMECSESTLSRRLSAVESKLALGAFGDARDRT
ncbi:helix-turn-helix domain-containing protein [Halalkalirubrum salinum]|uniref:helix-turn-helix domain-containing protein n=1 Tax=Halalkalirubrum salinum TaxID=2563889 RepID=UPI0010FB2215|nr:helix-turn-helix domain-containing protein [Halalkalirubrum salinum]